MGGADKSRTPAEIEMWEPERFQKEADEKLASEERDAQIREFFGPGGGRSYPRPDTSKGEEVAQVKTIDKSDWGPGR